ncbi:MAG: Crp/Fnr family transcriptional regulator [Wenzhouxiangella sp.]|nr:MAG: Crp/Fnr family transcriptional regulator [Wenzhouxiangella sp.]
MSEESCIVHKFSELRDLDAGEIDVLASLERDLKSYHAGERLQVIGAQASQFFTLHRGWACAVRVLADGQRQVLDIFLPGQIMGLREMGFDQTHAEIVALTDVEACPFPRTHLKDVFTRAPGLGELFFIVMAREQAMLTERMISIGRRPAVQRLAHFLLEFQVRLGSDNDDFELPLNQSVIGDALGLSAVHVSRTMAVLRKRGLVAADNGRIRILDIDALADLAEFERDYLDCRLRWNHAGQD